MENTDTTETLKSLRIRGRIVTTVVVAVAVILISWAIEVTMESVSAIASGTITKSKNYTYHAADGSAGWKIALTGTFAYNGTTSTCTSSSCSVEVYDSAWYVVSKSATRSGDTAYATVTIGHKFLGVTISKETYNLTLSCDKDGNVS